MIQAQAVRTYPDLTERAINVQTSFGLIPTLALCHEKGLAVHKIVCLGGEGNTWTITSISTGLSVITFLKSQRNAIAMLRKLVKLPVDWTTLKDGKSLTPEVKTQIKNIFINAV